MLDLHRKCHQGLYDRDCPLCIQAKGNRKLHQSLSPEEKSGGTLTLDLSGPH